MKTNARSNLLDELTERWPVLQEPAQQQSVTEKLEDIAANEASRLAKLSETNAAKHTQPQTEELLATMPKEILVEARAMLESPCLMEVIVEDLDKLGVAGEGKVKQTLFLVGVSRRLQRPLAAMLQGPSSSGKSFLVTRMASLFPPEAVFMATQLTPEALYYMDPGSLVHRFVVVGERRRAEDDHAADATQALRQMLSEGRLSKAVPIQMNGVYRTVLMEQEGPISYVECTTLTEIFEEDANRCILLTTDERPEQTRRILTATAAAYSGGVTDDAQRIIDRHHALQRMLKSHTVLIPFAERLAELIDDKRVETRRAFPHLLGLIQACCLLHQRQRETDSDGRLLANEEDYFIARHLLAGPLSRQLGGQISEPAARFLDRLREWFSTEEMFTTSDARRKETGSKSSVYAWLKELREVGSVEQVEAPRGNQAAKWQIFSHGQSRDAVKVLPTIKEVFRTN